MIVLIDGFRLVSWLKKDVYSQYLCLWFFRAFFFDIFFFASLFSAAKRRWVNWVIFLLRFDLLVFWVANLKWFYFLLWFMIWLGAILFFLFFYTKPRSTDRMFISICILLFFSKIKLRKYPNLTSIMIHIITHGCAAHSTFRCLLDTGMNAPITAHIGQTSLE